MNESLIEGLACPIDYSYPLQLQSSVRLGMKILEGELLCPSCGSRYEILAGIPRFLRLNQDSLSDIKRKEMEVRDSGSRRRKRYDLDIDRLPELDAIRAALGNCHGLRVLEAGCGVGQMTCAVQTASEVVALDFSWEGLSTFRFEGSAALDLIQGDVSQLPFREKFFDISLSAQVLEHVPSREMRQAFLARLTRALKPGGRLVLTTYNWDPERNTNEFLAAVPFYANHGLQAVSVNLQGGNPLTSAGADNQEWIVTAYNADGSLKQAWFDRLDKVIRTCSDNGIVVILGFFYFGQDHRLADEPAILQATDNVTDWLLTQGYTNVLVEINNEADVRYNHAILQPARVHELIGRTWSKPRHTGCMAGYHPGVQWGCISVAGSLSVFDLRVRRFGRGPTDRRAGRTCAGGYVADTWRSGVGGGGKCKAVADCFHPVRIT